MLIQLLLLSVPLAYDVKKEANDYREGSNGYTQNDEKHGKLGEAVVISTNEVCLVAAVGEAI